MADIEVSKYIQGFFEPYRIKCKEMKKVLDELNFGVEQDMADADSLVEFMKLDHKVGGLSRQQLQEWIKKVIKDKTDWEILSEFDKLANSRKVVKLFLKLFDVQPKGGNQTDIDSDSDNGISGGSNPCEDTIPPKETEKEPTVITFEKLAELIKNGKINKTAEIEVQDFEITDGLSVGRERADKEVKLRLLSDLPISFQCIAFVTDDNRVVAHGHLLGTGSERTVIIDSADIKYDILREKSLFRIILFDKKADAENYQGQSYSCWEKECRIDFQERQETNQTLCIDFGTSNTTAGTYGILNEESDEPEVVEFVDVIHSTPDKVVRRQVVPTFVYTQACGQEGIRFCFGYEAKKRLMDSGYNTDATVFHEIKRWLNDIEHEEEVCDKAGKKGKIARKEIIKQYIKYIIELSEQYFRCRFKKLHFSAPVKMKPQVIEMMKELLPEPEYKVSNEDKSLDEGTAVVYNYIAGEISSQEGEVKETKGSIMIIDCGGGTTDLASCAYKYQMVPDSVKLEVTNGFENGDANFGGNNITYRILQFLKVKLAAVRRGEPVPESTDLLQDNEEQIKTALDVSMTADEIYKKLFAEYQKAEAVIPTKFATEKYSETKKKKKRNYYYLWEMADQIKLHFFSSVNSVQVEFNEKRDKNLIEAVAKANDYYLYVYDKAGKGLEKWESPLNNIKITIKEIEQLLCPDLYALLNKLFNNWPKENMPWYENFEAYKLSGQSCKINMFKRLLMEFIPGKKLRNKYENQQQVEDRYKLPCLLGCIEFIKDRDFGLTMPEIKSTPPKMLYEISETSRKPVKKLFGQKDGGAISRFPRTANRAVLEVKDDIGRKKREITVRFALENTEQTIEMSKLREKIKEKNKNCKDEYIDNIINNIIDCQVFDDHQAKVLFLIPAANGYGFHFYSVAIVHEGDNREYYLQNDGKYYSFEDDMRESFFNGER